MATLIRRDLIVIFTGTSEVGDAAFKVFTKTLKDFPEEQAILRGCKNRFAFNDGDTMETNGQKVDNILLIAKKTKTGKEILKKREIKKTLLITKFHQPVIVKNLSHIPNIINH